MATTYTMHGLEPGDRLDQPTFHAMYELSPDDFHAELIEGLVYVNDRVSYQHGRVHGEVIAWLKQYETATTATRALNKVSLILANNSEPQPDGLLLILPEFGGRRSIQDGYLHGPPEVVVEVSLSSEAYDLHAKRRDYERYDVKEYLVVLLREKRVVWFVREEKKFTEMTPGDDGLLRSRLFGGLWLDPAALLSCDTKRVQEALKQGLDSKEHRRTAKLISKG